MATVHSIEELREQIEQRIRRGMVEASSQALEDMKHATDYFYHGGFPQWYHRTGALGNTPEIESVSGNINGMKYIARLNQSHQYSTGDRPSMSQVLALANYGTRWASYVRPTVGSKHFWEKAVEDIKMHTMEYIGNSLHR